MEAVIGSSKKQAERGVGSTPDVVKAKPPDPSTIEILRVLRRRIATREIPPGNKLQEQALAEEFRVPRIRVRDVLVALEQRGLIERQPNRSAVVKRLELTQVFELYDVREMLEGLSIRLATQNTRPGDWDALLATFKGEMKVYAEAGDLDRYIAGLDRFREATIAAAANPVLAEILDDIYDKAQAIIQRTVILPGRLEKGWSELLAVVEAMNRGDALEAERLRIENIRSQREFLQRYERYVL